VSLEAMKIPTAVIVTNEFVREAQNQAAVLGMPDVTPVVIDHPLSTLSAEQIGSRADQALAQVTQVWSR
jgi:hypothetical protein